MTDTPKKRKKPTSNTVRTMAWLDERGIVHQKVERWQSFFGKKDPQAKGRPGVRIDLFGGIDIVAIGEKVLGPMPELSFKPGFGAMTAARPYVRRHGVTGYQCCSDNGGAVEEHRQKLLNEPRLRLWVECGNRIIIHGWGLRALPREPGAKRGGKRRKVWTLREVELTLADFEAHAKA